MGFGARSTCTRRREHRAVTVTATRAVRPATVLLLLLASVLATCVQSEACGPTDNAARRSVAAQPLALGTRAYTFEQTVARDMAPRMFPDRPRGVAVQIVAHSDQSDGGLEPVCVRLTRGADVWQTRLKAGLSGRDERGRSYDTAGADSGPLWPAGDRVHLVSWYRIGASVYELDFGDVEIRAAV